jgi:multiple antibiotic resistance protein
MGANLTDLSLFVLGFSSLLPMVNPIGTAVIINPQFAGTSLAERKIYARSIAFFGFALGIAALFLGSWCLKFMGISVATTQMAGGLVIARLGLNLLNSKEETEEAPPPSSFLSNSLFYPLAFPLTVGPGCISVLVTLSAHASTGDLADTLRRMLVLSVSLFIVMVLTYLCFTYSDAMMRRIGKSGSQVLNRLMAFVLFCVGIQMLVNGLIHTFPHLGQ